MTGSGKIILIANQGSQSTKKKIFRINFFKKIQNSLVGVLIHLKQNFKPSEL